MATVVATIDVLRRGVAISLPALSERLRAAVYAWLLRTADWLWTVVVGLVALRRAVLLSVAAESAVRRGTEPKSTPVRNTTFSAASAIVASAGHAEAAPATVLTTAIVGPAAAILTAVSALATTVAVMPSVAALATISTLAAVSVMTPIAAAVTGSAAIVAPCAAILAAVPALPSAVASPGASLTAAVATAALIAPAAASVVSP